MPAHDIDYDRAFRQMCHVVAISRDQKEAPAVDNLLVTTIALDSDLAVEDAQTIRAGIDAYFGIRISKRLVDESLDRLLKDGRLLRSESALVSLPQLAQTLRSGARRQPSWK